MVSALLALAGLAGCASAPDVPTNVDATGMPNAELALRDSFQRVDGEMVSLGRMNPAPAQAAAEPVLPAELQQRVEFSWNGPLDGAVRKLADSIGYAVSVQAPDQPAPLPIAISTGPEEVFLVFKHLGEAAGAQATVQLDSLHHQVQVIHHV